jgi:hypothetical protein
MEISNFLAEIFGFIFIAVSLALLINQKMIKKLFLACENEVCLFFSGAISFILGIILIFTHNVWASNWRTIITVLGWLTLIKGSFLLFLPDLSKKWIDKFKDKDWLPIALVVTVFIGLFLVYLGFTI